MPLYIYECIQCNKKFEVLQRSYDVDKEICSCGGAAIRQIGLSSFQLKGSGWARDGYSKIPGADIDRDSGTVMRAPIYSDRNTGKQLGIGAPEVASKE